MYIGIHGHQVPAKAEDRFDLFRWQAITTLSLDMDYYLRRVLHQNPRALCYVRAYHPDVMANRPEWWAYMCYGVWEQAAQILRECGADPQKQLFIIPANELNLTIEHGGSTSGPDWTTYEAYQEINKWLVAWADAWMNRGGQNAVWPPLAPGHHEDNSAKYSDKQNPGGVEWSGFDILAPSLRHPAFVQIGTHFYADYVDGRVVGLDDGDALYLFQRGLLYHYKLEVELDIHKPRPILECNHDGANLIDVTADYEKMCRIKAEHNARGWDRVPAITWFIWSSGDGSFDPAMAYWLKGDPERTNRFILDFIDADSSSILLPPPPAPPTGVASPELPTASAPAAFGAAGQPTTLEALQQIYRFTYQPYHGDTSRTPDVAWKITRLVDDRSGTMEAAVYVIDAAGRPIPGVTIHFQTNAQPPLVFEVLTDLNGKASVGWNRDSQLPPNSPGPWTIWVAGDLPSDALAGIGWQGNHEKVVPTFQMQIMPASAAAPPSAPADDCRAQLTECRASLDQALAELRDATTRLETATAELEALRLLKRQINWITRAATDPYGVAYTDARRLSRIRLLTG